MASSDQQVQGPPDESVSCVDISPSNGVLASSWNAEMRYWQITNPVGQTTPQAMTKFNAPVLSCSLHNDSSKGFGALADGTVKCWDIRSNSSKDVGKHDSAVKEVQWVAPLNMLVTGSWDKSLRWWDLRSPNSVCTVSLSERCYALAVRDNVLVACTGDKKVTTFDLTKPNVPFGQRDTSMKLEHRCVDIFLDKTGFAVGSAEGRCAMQHIEPANHSKDFTFKCHRDNGAGSLAYPVHAISVHPTCGTFATSGGDGCSFYWDKDSRSRLKSFPKKNMPVTAAKFSPDGSFFVYATGYDWSQGKAEADRIRNDGNKKPQMYVHPVSQSEVQPKKKGFR